MRQAITVEAALARRLDDPQIHVGHVSVPGEHHAHVHVQQAPEPRVECDALTARELIAVEDQFVLYVPNWLPDPDGWYPLLDLLPWSGEDDRRQMVSYGDPYGHDRLARAPLPWPAEGPIFQLRQLLEAATGLSFNQCKGNKYPHGGVGISYHADAGDPVMIAIISAGAERRMGFRDADRRKCGEIALASGSLLLIDGVFNSRYQHGIDLDASITEPRISFTFRAFARPHLIGKKE